MNKAQFLDGMGTAYEPEPNTGCWLWIKGFVGTGYGAVWLDGKQWRASRLMWVLVNGPIPNGMYICHKCDQRSCVNPAHLFLGTQSDNLRDCVSKGRHKHLDMRGEKHGQSKLTEVAVREIRARLLSNELPRSIANDFGVADSTIRSIRSGRNWAWLD